MKEGLCLPFMVRCVLQKDPHHPLVVKGAHFSHALWSLSAFTPCVVSGELLVPHCASRSPKYQSRIRKHVAIDAVTCWGTAEIY